jgi:hypothetical protein
MAELHRLSTWRRVDVNMLTRHDEAVAWIADYRARL